MHGYGMYVYNDGVIYFGQYEKDKKKGYGLYHWTNGKKFEGWWINGK